MSQSTVVEWMNENQYRAYPLMPGQDYRFTLKKQTFDISSILVDANLVYSSLPSAVCLEKLVVSSNHLTIYLTGDKEFVFDLSQTFPIYLRSTDGSLLVLNENATPLIGLDDVYVFNNLQFEPSVCTELNSMALGVSGIAINTVNLGHPAAILDGYQFGWTPNGQNIQIEAGRNFGLVLPYGDYKGAANDCSSAINSIDGATSVNTGESINIVGGKHVKIFDDPDNHTIYIGLDFVADDIVPSKLLPPL